MRRELRITVDPIEPGGRMPGIPASQSAGAVLTFLGVVRGVEGGSPIAALEYEAHVPMAEHQFQKLFGELERRWPMIEAISVIHRIGRIRAGDPSLWVELHAPHREEAFAACLWLIDEMKRVVPIWKRPIPMPPTPASSGA